MTIEYWYGSMDTCWINSRTGERISFREERDGNIQVWLYGEVDEEQRWKRIGIGESMGEVAGIAREVAEKYDTSRYFAQLEDCR